MTSHFLHAKSYNLPINCYMFDFENPTILRGGEILSVIVKNKGLSVSWMFWTSFVCTEKVAYLSHMRIQLEPAIFFLIVLEVLGDSTNQKLWLVTLALGHLSDFAHGRVPEKNVEISLPHGFSTTSTSWVLIPGASLAHSQVTEFDNF